MPRSSGGARWVLGVFGLLHSISTSGILFCWPSIYLMLKRSHHYTSLCSNEEDGSGLHDGCVKADLQSAKMYTLALFFQSLLALPLGLFLDSYCRGGAIMYQSICVLGCVILALSPPYSSTGVDLILVGLILVSICGISILTLHMHVANLFPSAKVLYCNAVAATYVSSTIIFSIYEVINAGGAISLKAILLFHSFIMALFIILCFLLPSTKFNDGDQCAFGRIARQPGLMGLLKTFPWIGFYAIPKEAQDEDDDKTFDVTPMASIKSDLSHRSTGGDLTTADTLTTNESLSRAHNGSPGSTSGDKDKNQQQKTIHATTTTPLWKELLFLSISRTYVLVTLAELFWYYIASFYIASIQLQLTSLGFRILGEPWSNIIAHQAPELSEIDPDLGSTATTMQRVFSMCIFTGSIFSIGAGAIVDRFGFGPALTFQFALGMIHLIPQMITSFPVQILAFIGFSSQQDVMFALSCSYIGFRLGFKFQNALVGLQMALCGLLSLTIQPTIHSLTQSRTISTLFTPTLYTFFALAITAFAYPVYIFHEERQLKRINKQLEANTQLEKMGLPDIESSRSIITPRVHVIENTAVEEEHGSITPRLQQ